MYFGEATKNQFYDTIEDATPIKFDMFLRVKILHEMKDFSKESKILVNKYISKIYNNIKDTICIDYTKKISKENFDSYFTCNSAKIYQNENNIKIKLNCNFKLNDSEFKEKIKNKEIILYDNIPSSFEILIRNGRFAHFSYTVKE